MSRVWLAPSFVHLTSAQGETHLIAMRLYEESLATGEGRYTALCGSSVLVASMVAEPGRVCALCRAAASTAYH